MSVPPSPPSPPSPPQPDAVRLVLLRGVTPRCGTNYVRDLLVQHPGLSKARAPVWEDWVLDDAPLLREYGERLGGRWPGAWGVPLDLVTAELGRSLGEALVETLGDATEGTTTVAKTPSVNNLELFHWLFPDEVLVLLVRDGRSTVESLTTSFGWSPARALSAWTAGARAVRRFAESHPAGRGKWWTLLRYEDVLEDPVTAVDQVATVANLPTGAVSPDTASSLPVRGSSQRASEAEGLHWQPVDRGPDFDPLRRWDGWDARRHERFNWVAGHEMEHLGYELEGVLPAGRGTVTRHRVLDGAALGEDALRRTRTTVRRFLRHQAVKRRTTS